MFLVKVFVNSLFIIIAGCTQFHATSHPTQETSASRFSLLPMKLVIKDDSLDKLNYQYRGELPPGVYGSNICEDSKTTTRDVTVCYAMFTNTDRSYDAKRSINDIINPLLTQSKPSAGSLIIELTKLEEERKCGVPCILLSMAIVPYFLGLPSEVYTCEVEFSAKITDKYNDIVREYKRIGHHTLWEAMWADRITTRIKCLKSITDSLSLMADDIKHDSNVILNILQKGRTDQSHFPKFDTL